MENINHMNKKTLALFHSVAERKHASINIIPSCSLRKNDTLKINLREQCNKIMYFIYLELGAPC